MFEALLADFLAIKNAYAYIVTKTSHCRKILQFAQILLSKHNCDEIDGE